jgi:NAD(P)-dependent dehydrogenase (short-subunit alcohol dehydrogenase family)
LPETKAEGVKGIMMGRLGQPREIAYAIAYLISDEASFVTGQLLSPNGGVITGI